MTPKIPQIELIDDDVEDVEIVEPPQIEAPFGPPISTN